MAGDFTGEAGWTWPAFTSSSATVLQGNGDGTFADASQFATTPHATPLVADVNGDGTDDVLVVDGAGNILYRQGIPGQPGTLRAARHDQPRTNPSRDIAWVPEHRSGPAARQRRRPATTPSRSTPSATAASSGSARSRPAGCRRRSSRPTSTATAWTTWSSATPATAPSRSSSEHRVDSGFIGPVSSFMPRFPAAVTLPVGLGVSDVQAVDTTGSGALDLVVTNKLTGQVSVLRNLGDGHFAAAGALSRRDRVVRDRSRRLRPRSPAWRRRRAWPPGRSRPAVRPTW